MLPWSVHIAFRTPAQEPWAAQIYARDSKPLFSLQGDYRNAAMVSAYCFQDSCAVAMG